jgi:hypothetical protein
MKVLRRRWNVHAENNAWIVEKWCPNCKKKTEFRDSGKRRQNANGKNIFEYAIYKCKKGHTWNLKLRKYKAGRRAP